MNTGQSSKKQGEPPNKQVLGIGFSFANGLRQVILGINYLAYLGIVFMALVIIANVIGRYFFRKPILGTVEIVEMAMIIIVFLAISFTDLYSGHVNVDILISKFPKPIQKTIAIVTNSLCLIIVGILTYKSFANAIDYIKTPGEVTSLLEIPLSPFRFIVAVGFLLLFFNLLTRTLNIKIVRE